MRDYRGVIFVTAAVLSVAVSAGAQETKDMKGLEMSKSGEALEQAQGVGVVKAIDAAAGSVTIQHEPIKSFNWPSMSMKFKVADPTLLNNVAAGNKVEFTLHGKDMMKTKITALKVIG